jgi:uncharacterized membrane protein YkvI
MSLQALARREDTIRRSAPESWTWHATFISAWTHARLSSHISLEEQAPSRSVHELSLPFHRVMSLVKWIITHIAPVFIVTSPVTSYADQIWSINKSRSSAGFSLDIPLIMLVSSILKYVWPTGSAISACAAVLTFSGFSTGLELTTTFPSLSKPA